ncbi:hypothetical protein [Myroides sp. DW712]|uniref:hypothetical protein n=1 Tax=Myroides sp. DW712 TaxID=3389800 RepID=UPI00397B707D
MNNRHFNNESKNDYTNFHKLQDLFFTKVPNNINDTLNISYLDFKVGLKPNYLKISIYKIDYTLIVYFSNNLNTYAFKEQICWSSDHNIPFNEYNYNVKELNSFFYNHINSILNILKEHYTNIELKHLKSFKELLIKKPTLSNKVRIVKVKKITEESSDCTVNVGRDNSFYYSHRVKYSLSYNFKTNEHDNKLLHNIQSFLKTLSSFKSERDRHYSNCTKDMIWDKKHEEIDFYLSKITTSLFNNLSDNIDFIINNTFSKLDKKTIEENNISNNSNELKKEIAILSYIGNDYLRGLNYFEFYNILIKTIFFLVNNLTLTKSNYYLWQDVIALCKDHYQLSKYNLEVIRPKLLKDVTNINHSITSLYKLYITNKDTIEYFLNNNIKHYDQLQDIISDYVISNLNDNDLFNPSNIIQLFNKEDRVIS